MEVSSNACTNYNGFSAYLNKDNLYSNMRQNTQVVQNELQEQTNQKIDTYTQKEELTKEQTVAVYFNYQNNQAMKSKMEMMIEEESSSEDETLTYKEVHKMQEQKNRNELLDMYANANNEQMVSQWMLRI